MTKGVRIQPVIPTPVYDQLVQHIEHTGFSVSQVVSHLLHTYLPKAKSDHETKPEPKPVDPNKRLAELLKQVKPFVDKINAGTITRRDYETMQPISDEISATKMQLGMPTNRVDRLAEFDAKRSNIIETIEHMESEYQNLQARSRVEPLDEDDTYRVKELLMLIPQYKRDLEDNYPL